MLEVIIGKDLKSGQWITCFEDDSKNKCADPADDDCTLINNQLLQNMKCILKLSVNYISATSKPNISHQYSDNQNYAMQF